MVIFLMLLETLNPILKIFEDGVILIPLIRRNKPVLLEIKSATLNLSL